MLHTRSPAAAVLLLAAALAPAQEVCQPWFKHRQFENPYPGFEGVALVDLQPGGWPVFVGNLSRRDRFELWQFDGDQPPASLGTLEFIASPGLLAADFDLDGDSDLFALLRTDNGLHILENTGGALIEGPGTIVRDVIGPLCVADFNGDSLPDVVCEVRDDFLLLLNAGDGTFAQSARLRLYDRIVTAFPADLNLDGLTDLLVQTEDEVCPFRQREGGLFDRLAVVDTTRSAELMVAGDLNGDGATDFILPGKRVYLGVGNGHFSMSGTLDGRVRQPVKLGDLDNDGDLDLLVNVGADLESRSMLNDGQGVFTLIDNRETLSSYGTPAETLLFDMDGDGNLDVITDRDGQIDLRFGRGDGTFDEVGYTHVFNRILRRSALADMDGDGDLDVVASGDNPEPTIKVLANDGSAHFTETAAMTGHSTVWESPVPADFDRDGRPDIFVWTDTDGLWIYKNTDDGLFSESHIIPHEFNGYPSHPCVADLNADGLPDIVAGGLDADNQGYVVYVNQGDWVFERRLNLDPATDHTLTLADFNNDGVTDLLCASTDPEDTEMRVCFGNGDASFGDPVPTGIIRQSYPFVTTGDFNGDGWTDLAAYGYCCYRMEIMLNQRDGSFAYACTLDRTGSTRNPGVVDLDDDGIDELIVASQLDRTAAVYFFNAFGELRREELIGDAPPQALGSTAADLNGDGAADVLVSVWAPDTNLGGISVLLNQCPGAPCLPDTDHDGDTDTDDFTAYLTRWADQRDADCSDYNCTADLNRDGSIDTRDLVRFLAAWAAGC